MTSDRKRRDGGRADHGRAGATIGALLGAAAASAVLALALVLRLREALSGHTGPWRVDTATEVGVTAVGVLVAAWLAGSALVAAVCLVVRAAGARWRTGERLVHRYAPQVVRKALVLAVGASIGLGMASGASAAAPVPTPTISTSTSTSATDLGWVVTETHPEHVASDPVQPTAPVPDPPEATVAQATAAVTPVSSTVVVSTGDSLWAIAARHLPAGATEAEIAAAWPRWYEANASVVGADPDVIRPGQVLTVPAAAAEGSR